MNFEFFFVLLDGCLPCLDDVNDVRELSVASLLVC